MRQKIKEQKEAREMRKTGSSIKEIAETLGVSKGFVSTWVRDVELSNFAKKKIDNLKRQARLKANNTHRENKQKRLQYIQKQAQAILNKKDPNKIFVSLIYWCEGAKSDKRLELINSDPNLISTFLSLLRKEFLLDESKFRVCLHLHPYHNEEKQLSFWSKTTNISKQQFIKSYQKKSTKKRIREGYQGCASVRYHDASLAQLLMSIAKELMKNNGSIG